MQRGGERGRREYLSSLGGLLVGVSGVRLGDSAARGARNEPGPLWPTITSPWVSEWKQAARDREEFDRGVSFVSVTGTGRTRIFGYEPLRRRVSERFDVRFRSTLATFFATQVTLGGFFTAAVTPEIIGEQIEPQFVERMRNRDVHDIRRIEPAAPLPDVPEPNEIYEYRGEYTLPERVQRRASATGSGGGESGEGGADGAAGTAEGVIPIVGLFAVWKTESETAFAAGGAYPATGSVEVEDGTVDLQFDPERFRVRMNGMVESVE